MLFYLVLLISIIISFILGIFIAKLSLKNSNLNSEFKTSFSELRNLILDFQKQNIETSLDVKYAIKTTSTLVNQLTTNQNLKGKYGEECLDNVLKCCFPNKKIDFINQFVTKNKSDENIRPDYVVNLPNNKNLIIDCKLNIDKFVEFNEANDDKKEVKKKELISDLNSTVNLLANKKYETSIDLATPDFILMYIPLEPVITLIYTDNDFYSVVKNANEKNIIIVGNASIITSIRLVSLLWAQHQQNNNVENIIKIAKNLYNITAKHSIQLVQLKQTINLANDKINSEFQKLSDNNILFKEVEKFKDYGIDVATVKNGKKLQEISIDENFLK